MSEGRLRVIHVLPHVAAGGATLLAMELAQRLDPDRYNVKVAVGPEDEGEGSLLEEMRERGINVIVMPHMRRAPKAVASMRAR